MHAYHQKLPGYHEDQVLVDGCAECEQRARQDSHGINHLDTPSFIRAWHRAAEWNKRGLPTVSAAEAPLLNALWAVQVQLERLGVPIGVLPVDPAASL